MYAFYFKEANEYKTRSKSKKESEMSATEGKFDAVLTKMDAKMDDLLKAKAKQEVKVELHS